MSWIVPTIAILLVALACCYGLCEWIVMRRSGGNDDNSAMS